MTERRNGGDRGVFRTQSSIYDGAFCSVLDVRLSSEYASGISQAPKAISSYEEMKSKQYLGIFI